MYAAAPTWQPHCLPESCITPDAASVLMHDIAPDQRYRPPVTADSADSAQRFGQLLKSAREQLGWSQEELAEKARVGRATVQRYELGKTATPDPVSVRAILKTLGIHPGQGPIALGFVTPDELELPPTPPPLDPVLARAKKLLDDPAIPDRAKDTLRRGINAAIDLWFEAYGVGQAPREPSADERGSGRARRPGGRRSGQAV